MREKVFHHDHCDGACHIFSYMSHLSRE